MARPTKLELVPGTTGRWLASITNSAGAAMALDDLESAWFTIKEDPADADAAALAQLTLLDGLSVDSPSSDGDLTIVLAPDVSEGWTPGTNLYWDLRLKFADGTVEVPELLSGRLLLLQPITDATKN